MAPNRCLQWREVQLAIETPLILEFDYNQTIGALWNKQWSKINEDCEGVRDLYVIK
jgi:hypothetical protein